MPSTQENLRKTLTKFYENPVAKVSLELFLSLGTIIFFALFAIRPTLITMSNLLKEIEDKKALAVQLDRKIAALATVQSEYLQLQAQLGVLDQALPNTPQLVYSLKVIEKVASDNQLAIESLGVNILPEENAVSPTFAGIERLTVPLTIAVTGNYPNIRQFIEDLQSYRRSYIVDTIIFNTSEEKGALKLNAVVTISIPYYGNPPAQSSSTKNEAPATKK